MNMFEEARTIDGMIKMCKMTQGEIAKKLGVSQSYVGNKLRLLNFSDRAQKMIIFSELSERHARVLLRIKDEQTLLDSIDKVRERKMTVAQCEAMVDVLCEAEVPKLLGRAPKQERVDRFESFISSSVESLCSLGIPARREIGYYGKKKYIMISIEDF